MDRYFGGGRESGAHPTELCAVTTQPSWERLPRDPNHVLVQTRLQQGRELVLALCMEKDAGEPFDINSSIIGLDLSLGHLRMAYSNG